MKYLLVFSLFMGPVMAQNEVSSPEIEVGSPRDCVVLGTSEEQNLENVRPEFQKMVMKCLAPQEEETLPETENTHPAVVSQ